MTAAANEPASTVASPADQAPRQRSTLSVPTIVYALFILLETLAPFHFTVGARGEPASRMLRVTFSSIAWTDLVANTALFAPFGALLVMRSCLLGRGILRAIATALVLGSALSLTLEIIQAYCPDRVSSIVDVAANVLGTMLGIVCGLILLRAHVSFQRTWRDAIRQRPREARIAGVLMGLILFAGMPFALTFDVSRTSSALKGAEWAPFAEYHSSAHSRPFGSTADLAPLPVLLRRERIEHALGDVAEFASFALFAWLLAGTFRTDYGFRTFPSILLTAWVTGGLALLFSAMQIFVVGRGWTSTDVVVRTAGGLAGAAARLVSGARGRALGAAHDNASMPCTPGFARAAAWCIGAYILVSGLTPFAWRSPADRTVSWADAQTWTPFASYFHGRFDVAMHDLMIKTGSFVLFGCAFTWARLAARSKAPRVRAVMLPAIAMATVIELAQCFIESRVASITDPILAAVGAAVGHELAIRWTRASADAPVRASAVPPAWTLTDALVGQLIEPPTGDVAQTAKRSKRRRRRKAFGGEDSSPTSR